MRRKRDERTLEEVCICGCFAEGSGADSFTRTGPDEFVVAQPGFLPQEGTVIQLPSTSPDAEVLDSCRRLRQAGYSLALDTGASGTYVPAFLDHVDLAASGEIFDRIRLVAQDPRRNLAVLDIAGVGLPAVQIGNSDTVEIRGPFIVLGITVSPEGFRPSLSEGTIGGIQIEPAGFRTFQMQVALSQEDAGAPGLSRAGEVIGMVLSPPASGEPGSVIPSNDLLGLIDP